MNRTGIIALAVVMCLVAFTRVEPSLSAAQGKSLRDEVREKGFAKHGYWEDLPRTEMPSLENLVKRSSLIILGQVVNESARLSEDESTVLTDYTISISEILKDSRKEFNVGDRVVVSKYGGSTILEGKPVEIDNTTFPPIAWRTSGLFFVVRADKPNAFWKYTFTRNDFGVWLFKNGKLSCETERKKTIEYTSKSCGRSEADVLAALRNCIAQIGDVQ